jgi:hypothetical protein
LLEEQVRVTGLFFIGLELGSLSGRVAETTMVKWIGVAMLALGLTFGGLCVQSALAASGDATAKTIDHKAGPVRHHVRRHPRYSYRSYVQPTYLDRPYYYEPAPNPALAFGFGFGPWW